MARQLVHDCCRSRMFATITLGNRPVTYDTNPVFNDFRTSADYN